MYKINLHDLILSPNYAGVVSEIETPLKDAGRIHALCLVYQKLGDSDEKLLDLWAG